MRKQYDDHTHVHAPVEHTWKGRGTRVSTLFWFCSFGFGCNAIPPPFEGWDAEQLHPATAVLAARTESPRHSRPAEKFSFWWLVILIFLVVCQPGRASYLCDQPTRESDWAFSGSGAASSRRYCGNGNDDDGDDGDGTSCSNSSHRSKERYRSCSVSIQTVVVLSKAASVVAAAAAVLPCPYE